MVKGFPEVDHRRKTLLNMLLYKSLSRGLGNILELEKKRNKAAVLMKNLSLKKGAFNVTKTCKKKWI